MKAQVTSGSAQVGTVGCRWKCDHGQWNDVTVPLTNVGNAQTLTITLFSVNDGTSTGDVYVPMKVLLGDTSNDGIVNSSDVSQTKAQSGAPVTGSNFREDTTVDDTINSSDVSQVKSKSGTSL